MPTRSLSRAIALGASACTLALASAGAAVAAPAPDQQNPIAQDPKPVPQQAPTWPADPQVLHRPVATPSADSEFQWDDAGIGAGGALAVVLAGLGATLVLRRRRVTDPPLAA